MSNTAARVYEYKDGSLSPENIIDGNLFWFTVVCPIVVFQSDMISQVLDETLSYEFLFVARINFPANTFSAYYAPVMEAQRALQMEFAQRNPMRRRIIDIDRAVWVAVHGMKCRPDVSRLFGKLVDLGLRPQ